MVCAAISKVPGWNQDLLSLFSEKLDPRNQSDAASDILFNWERVAWYLAYMIYLTIHQTKYDNEQHTEITTLQAKGNGSSYEGNRVDLDI